MISSDVGPFSIVPRWLIDSELSHTAIKLYAILADHANYNTGEATVSRKSLARRLGQKAPASLDTVDRAKNELVELGALTVTPRFENVDGQLVQRSNSYVVHMVDPSRRDAPPSSDGVGEGGPTDAAQNENHKNESSSSSSTARAPKQVSGKNVTEAEHDDVDVLLACFNELAGGKRFAGREWRESIIRRMREHPELPLEEHLELVGLQFKWPWWKGDPSPSVIWGNGKVFDRVLNKAAGDPADDMLKGYTKA